MTFTNNLASKTIKVMPMNRKPRHIVDEDEITRFNLWRENKKGVVFHHRTRLLNALNEGLAYPLENRLITELCRGENPPIIKQGNTRNTKYCVSPTPVHMQRLQTVWDYVTGHISKQKPNMHSELYDKIHNNPEMAITILKEMGYRIQKITYVDV